MTQLRLYLLGSPRITLNEMVVAPKTRKALALFIYMAVTNDRHGRDGLATLFWRDQDQTGARRSLRHALWLLRQAGLRYRFAGLEPLG